MQCGNLLIKLIAALIEALETLRQRVTHECRIDAIAAGCARRGIDLLHHVEQASRVTIGIADDEFARGGVNRQRPVGLKQGTIEQSRELSFRQRLQHVNRRA